MANIPFNVMGGALAQKTKAPKPGEKTKEVLLSEELLEAYSGARQTWAIQAQEDIDFRNNAQWTKVHKDKLKARQQSPVTDNVIHPAVSQAVAQLTANKPKFQSTGREDSDTRTGRLFSDLMSYIWDLSDGNAELKRVVDDYYTVGMGVIGAYTDPRADFGRGEIFIKGYNPLDMYFDPNARDRFVRDSAHILIARSFTGEQLVRQIPGIESFLPSMMEENSDRYPSTGREGSEGQQTTPQSTADPYHKHYEVIDRYSKILLDFFHVLDTTNQIELVLTKEEYSDMQEEPAIILMGSEGVRQIITDEEGVQEAVRILEQFGEVFHQMENPETGQPEMMAGEEHEGAIPGSTTRIVPVTKKDLIDQGTLIVNTIIEPRIKRVYSAGGLEIANKTLPIDEYPFVTIMNRHNQNPYPMSDVRFVRPMQEYINKLTSLIMAHASSSTNTKLLIPRGAMDKKELRAEWGRAGTGVIEFDPELGKPVVAGPIPLPNELYKNKEDAKQSVYLVLGIHPLSQGDPTEAPQTYKGTVAIDEYSQRRMKSKIDDVDSALNQLGKIVIQLIQNTYQERKVIRLLRPNNKPRELMINKPIYDDVTQEFVGRMNDVTVGKYDLIVVSGSTLPSNKWARFEYYMELYKSGIIDREEVLKQTEVADYEGVLNRIGQVEQLTRALEAEKQTTKDLKGDLQTARRESVNKGIRLEIEKGKSEVKGISQSTKAAAALFEQRLQDRLRQFDQENKNRLLPSSSQRNE